MPTGNRLCRAGLGLWYPLPVDCETGQPMHGESEVGCQYPEGTNHLTAGGCYRSLVHKLSYMHIKYQKIIIYMTFFI